MYINMMYGTFVKLTKFINWSDMVALNKSLISTFSDKIDGFYSLKQLLFLLSTYWVMVQNTSLYNANSSTEHFDIIMNEIGWGGEAGQQSKGRCFEYR